MARRPSLPGAPATLLILMIASLAAACATVARTGPSERSAGPSAIPAATVLPATFAHGASAPAAQPPAASLAAEGGDPMVGRLGSYTWLDGGSDSPWLPGTPMTVGAAEPLSVTLGDGVAIAAWSARRVAAGTTDGSGAVALGSGGGPPVSFAAPGPGSWSVQVDVRFADDLGSATYYWQLAVR